jgi:hypothetical protein
MAGDAVMLMGNNKSYCEFESCMYVWGLLHVQGRRISSRARRRQKFTDSYPFLKIKFF